MNVAFLYNHDALHQVRHTAPVAAALTVDEGVSVSILCSSMAQENEARLIMGEAAARAHFVQLAPGRIAAGLDRLLGAVAPFRRLAVLRSNLAEFARYDAIVVPETTTLMLKNKFNLAGPRMIWIPHGAGDRSIGFRKVASAFDLVLVAGAKTRDRLLAAGVVTEQSCRIVGYPKFDSVSPAEPGPPLFENSRPTVLYNPHFDPRLSSWYEMGEAILDWFAAQDRFNLVFAPHVMLFERRLHASVEHRMVRWRRDLDARFRQSSHVLIDTGSARSSDMTYTRSADIYLGDASSQIYEWIARPRPALLANPNRLEWKGSPDFAHWNLGDVVENVDAMKQSLDRAVTSPDRYRDAQAKAFADTFSVEPLPASQRAARAICDLFQESHRATLDA